ncbi:MAG: amino acid adenylation domain-containing protein, partial [Candidatus Latescibacterota bacterium]
CCIKYNAAVLRDDDICLVRDAFNALAEDVSIDPDKSLDDVRILPPVVLHHVIDVFPAGEDIASDGLTFPALFAAQVRKCPDRTAVEAVDGVLTYRELDAASDAVACELLTTAGVVPGERVALMTGRDRWMIPGIIGIMKASAVFVPLDPDYPDDRIRFILEDCGCRTVIVSGENGLRFTGYPNLTVLDARRAVGSAQNLPYDRLPECGDPAYVIYTSGSTGQPKGVMVGHQALANFIRGYTYSVLNCHNGPLRIAFVAKYIFDAAGRAFYPSLCRGDTVCVVDEETRLDGAALLRFLAARSIDLFDGTPSLCSLAIEGGDRIDTLRQVVLGGEALKQSLVDRIRTAFPQAAVTNVYGPTETTIDSTFHHVDLSPGRDWNILPIGRPLPNQRVYVLDDLLHPLPVGAVGEICIGGKGVADGYLNREDLTGERFVTDPFNPGGMLYRTGDLGRWEREGNLIFLGRRDSQVKVRGFRIEPGEIEAAISSMAEIKWCAIVPKSDSEDAVSLYAFYEGSLTPREMRRKLRLTLPAHMIPDHFMAVDRIPLTATGKIDRRALSELTGTEPVRAAVTITSTSETERRMIASMGRILGRVDISGEDNFFEIGGHSLLAARLASNIAASMGKRLPISAIYRFPTPAELADFFTRYDPELNGFLGEFRFHFNEASEVLYCFPPYGATGIIYHPLARHLDRWRLECFNFLADGGFVRDAVRAILPSAQKSPVNILGYSGGGNLAFEVTREIENRGGRVGRIIMLDTYCRLETADVSPQRHQLEMEGIVASAEYSVFFPDAASKTAAVRNGTAYAAYLYSGIDTGMIKSPISIICADDETPDPVRDRYGALRSRNGWKNLTHASFECVRGSGSHDEMVNEKNCAYNSALIRKFLSDHQG